MGEVANLLVVNLNDKVFKYTIRVAGMLDIITSIIIAIISGRNDP